MSFSPAPLSPKEQETFGARAVLWSASGLCKFCMTVFLSVTDG
jgi:hypothetical protein